MTYLIAIFKWDKEVLEWNLLHYSHNLQDAEKWFEYYQKNYQNVRMMVDVNQIKNQDAKKNFAEFVERMKHEALRKKQVSDSNSGGIKQPLNHPTSDKQIISGS